MAFSDPQTLTINAVDHTCNKVSSSERKSVYRTADEGEQLTISHQETKNRTRHMVRVDSRVVAADPLTAENEYKSAGIYIVIDEPEFGFSDAELDYRVQALKAWLTTANVTAVLSDQH